MGFKARKALKKVALKKGSISLVAASQNNSPDFLTGKPKHYGFIELESAEVAKIVADSMDDYLLYEHLFQVYPIPPDHVHPKLSNMTRKELLKDTGIWLQGF